MRRFVNIIYKVSIAVILSAAIPVIASAQEYTNTPVEISKEKIKIDGNICYSHIVLEKQTLYSISKAYGVSIDDIHRFNPSLKEPGLKKNSILIIPAIEIHRQFANFFRGEGGAFNVRAFSVGAVFAVEHAIVTHQNF